MTTTIHANPMNPIAFGGVFQMWTKGLSDRAKNAVRKALVSRGNRQGMLLKSCPSEGDGMVAWQSLMGWLAPVRVSVWKQIGFTQEQKDLFVELETWGKQHIAWMNRNLQKPFEFNLWHFNHE